MTDRENLFAACLEHPDEDTPRLVLADYLDEQPAGRVACPTCGPYRDDPCPRCDGKKVLHGGYEYSPTLGGHHPTEPCPECDGTGKFPPGCYPERDPASGRHEGGWTNCKTCNGGGANDSGTPGTVVDASDADLAELIRVQCEAWRRWCGPHSELHYQGTFEKINGRPITYEEACHKTCSCDWCALRTRERELLAAHPSWLRDLSMLCPGCGGKGESPRAMSNAGNMVSQGFCGTCGGTGDLLLQMQGLCTRNPTLTRGLTLAVSCRLDEVLREVEVDCPKRDPRLDLDDRSSYAPHWNCLKCQGRRRIKDWQPTPWALAFRDACVRMERVPWWVVTDHSPAHSLGGSHYWEEAGGDAGYSLPVPVFDLLADYTGQSRRDGLRHDGTGRRQKHYPTPAAARHALESAVYRFVRAAK